MRVSPVRLFALVLPLAFAACADPGANTTDPSAGLDWYHYNYYHSTKTARDELRLLAATFPDRAKLLGLGRSWEGREIPALAITAPTGAAASKPNIYILGGHHGGEWIGVEVPLRFGRYLLEHEEDDAAVGRALLGAQFYIVPILNPDGLDITFQTFELWRGRKNRRDNGDGTWGVDLNRNYPVGWDCNDPDTASLKYRGPQPFSEPESQAMRDFMLSHPPAGVLEYHSYGQIIYPPLPRQVSARDIELWRTVGPEMARLMFSVSGRVYTASGSDRTYGVGDIPDPSPCRGLGQLFGWTHDRFAAPSFLIELPPASDVSVGLDEALPAVSDIDGIVAEQRPAILYFADYVIQRTGDALRDLSHASPAVM